MNATEYTTITASKTAQWLALGAVIGPIIFTFTWLVLGFISPGYPLWNLWIAPYSAISQPISGLGLGQTAPFMNFAFILLGILMIVGAIGVFQSIPELGNKARWICTILMALPGVGAMLDGIFTLESFMLHFLGFGLALTPIAGFVLVGLTVRQIPYWKQVGKWLLLAGPMTLILTGLYFATFDPEVSGANIGIAGLTERILLVELVAWYMVMGWRAFKQSSQYYIQ